MLNLDAILLGVVLPAVTASAALLAIWRPWRKAASPSGTIGAGALAIGLAYAAGYAALVGWPPFPPVEATQWILYLLVAAAGLCLLERMTSRPPNWLLWGFRVGLVAVALVLILRPMMTYSWSPGRTAVWLAGLCILALVFWLELEWVLPGVEALSSWFVLTIVAVGCSLCLAVSGSLLLGQLGGVLAAAAAGATFPAFLPGGRTIDRASVRVPAVILTCLLLSGYFYSELPAISALLVTVAPLAARSVPQASLAGRRPFIVAVVRGAAVAVPIVVAVIIAFASSPPLDPYY
jgi:hypothetical protein